MKNLNRFYTYAYLRKDRTPYYIGKGQKDRVYSKNRKGIRTQKDKSRIIFLKQNLTEEEAFKHEIYMIAVFGRKDLGTGILHNRTNGGEGMSGVIITEEWRRKIGEANKGKMRSEKTRKKLSKLHKGKKRSEESRRKQSESIKGKNNWCYGKPKSKEIKEKLKELNTGENNPNYGKKWWIDSNGNTEFSIECPGEGWVIGRGRVWNDGKGNDKFSIECPGEGWVIGRKKINRKESNLWIGQNKHNCGKKWWNNGKGNSIMSAECPGEGWFPGRGKLKNKV